MRLIQIVFALLLLSMLAGCGGGEWHLGAYIDAPTEIGAGE